MKIQEKLQDFFNYFIPTFSNSTRLGEDSKIGEESKIQLKSDKLPAGLFLRTLQRAFNQTNSLIKWTFEVISPPISTIARAAARFFNFQTSYETEFSKRLDLIKEILSDATFDSIEKGIYVPSFPKPENMKKETHFSEIREIIEKEGTSTEALFYICNFLQDRVADYTAKLSISESEFLAEVDKLYETAFASLLVNAGDFCSTCTIPQIEKIFEDTFSILDKTSVGSKAKTNIIIAINRKETAILDDLKSIPNTALTKLTELTDEAVNNKPHGVRGIFVSLEKKLNELKEITDAITSREIPIDSQLKADIVAKLKEISEIKMNLPDESITLKSAGDFNNAWDSIVQVFSNETIEAPEIKIDNYKEERFLEQG